MTGPTTKVLDLLEQVTAAPTLAAGLDVLGDALAAADTTLALARVLRGEVRTHPADVPAPAALDTPPLRVLHDGSMVHLVGGAGDTEQARVAALALAALDDRIRAADAVDRLDRNEALATMGSYDWHIPTDTNRWSDGLYDVYGEVPQSFNASYERFMEFVHPDDRERVRAVHAEAFETGDPYETEERIVRADGTVRVLWTNGQVLFDEQGTPVRVVGICRDITEQRELEAAALEHSARVARVEELRRQALEVNDNVVQSLTAAAWALDAGRSADAVSLVRQTLGNAIEMMDGLLAAAEMQVGAGDLVRTGAPPAAVPSDEVTVLDHGTERTRIVIADDSDDIRLMLRFMLEQHEGIEVVGEAGTGREAIDEVTRHVPDVLLLDLAMPDVDGLQATAALRETNTATRIVVLTGYADPTIRERAMAAGADGFLVKTSDVRQVVDAIREVMAQVG
jgi:CheY-like chemotaxis protein/PAS domain-containing protein